MARLGRIKLSIKITPADQWFSRCIREAADWTCERCGSKHAEKSQGLHCAHYMTRGNWGTRFDPDNVAALCYGCHSYLDREPYEKAAWFEARLGAGLAQIVKEKAKRPAYGIKKLKGEIATFYRAQYQRLLTMRADGVTGRIEVEGWL